MTKFRETTDKVSRFLFRKANKELLIFLFFLVIAGIFWLLMTLNQTYEQDIRVVVRMTGVPKNVVLTSEETDTVKVSVRDKGYVIMTYLYGKELPSAKAVFRHHMKDDGAATISTSELKQLVASALSASTAITQLKPDRLEFFYNYGAAKRVPIRWSGRVIPEHLYFISSVSYSSDSVTAYAPKEKLDSITLIYTEKLNYVNFRDTLVVDCQLQKMPGVKLVPDRVTVSFTTDVLTEESIDGIPIKAINMPEGMTLRTFPAKVRVSFVAGVSVFRNLTADDFEVIADYNDLAGKKTDKCPITLRRTPAGISRASLETTQVDYLVEEQQNDQ